MTWDPREDGALCDACPLREAREGPPVPTYWPKGECRAIIVGECPGVEEVKRGEPFVGQAGRELQDAIRAVGIPVASVARANVISCRPPGEATGALDRFLKMLEKERTREARGEGVIEGAILDDPRDCCRPRLLAELASCPNVIPVGGTALHAVCGGAAGILNARGSPITLPAREEKFGDLEISTPALRVLPTVHPSFVMRKRRWRGAFRADLARAFRWFSTGLAWRDPKILLHPTPAQLHAALEAFAHEPFTVFDIETSPGFPEADHFDPLFDRLRCVGIGTADRAVIVPFRSVDPEHAPFYAGSAVREIVGLVKLYLTSPRWRKVTWNGRAYDRVVLESRLGLATDAIAPHLDALGLHKLAEPELPHDLGYSGSIYTDAHDWKAANSATEAKTDEELWRYNSLDVAVTSMCVPALKRACDARKQAHLVKFFSQIQDACVELHRNGLLVDQARRREWDKKLVAQCMAKRREIRELTGRSKLNPASVPQIRDLLFETLQVLPYRYTDTGDPSTDDDSLRTFMSSGWGLPARTRAIVSTLRDYRRYAKRRGVVVRLRPITEDYYEAPDLALFEETEEEKEERLRRVERGKSGRACGLVLPDGRVHASFTPHGTVGWRIACNKPNVLNIETKLRDMFVAAPGNVLVGCDEAQLELRMVVGLAKCAYYLERFADEKGDPHHDLCVDVFGEPYLAAGAAGRKKLRRSIKELTYSSLYGAGDETKHEIVTSAEDDETETLLFPDFSLREVQAFTRAWHARCPEIAIWWDSVIDEWKRQGFLAEPILGLRCDFLDGEDRNRMLSLKPQSGGAALAWMAYFRAVERIEREAPKARFVHQGYDSLVFECPENEGQTVSRILVESMSDDAARFGLPMKFLGEMKIGKVWKEV